MYMQSNDVIEDKGVKAPALYAISPAMEHEPDERQIPAHGFIHKWTIGSYCR